MSREVCGICWCPYDEDTGECACEPDPTAVLPRKPRHISYVCPQCHWSLDERKPLSEEELSKIIDAEIGFNSCVGWEEGFARAIERAHGIGGQP